MAQGPRFVIARRPQADVASREGSCVFADGFPVIRHCPARFPRRFAPRNDTSGWCSGAPVPLYSLISLHKALTTRKGHAASVRRQSRQRLRSERRYRRNWYIPFYRRLVPTAGTSPGAACRSPTTPPPKSDPAQSFHSGQDFFCSVIPQAARRSFRYRPCHSAGPTCRTSAALRRRPS
mgnify:CR=1 FL=1